MSNISADNDGKWLLSVVTLYVFILLFASKADADTLAQAQTQRELKVTTILISINDQKITASLNDSAASRDFVSMLPLRLTLQDFNKTEKVSDLPAALSTEGAPSGFEPKSGDITYYAPWGNLAIFYRDFKYSPGLVSMGRIDSDLDILAQPGPLTALIELVE